MWEHGWSSNEAHPEGEGGVQYKEASKVNSALAAVKFVRTPWSSHASSRKLTIDSDVVVVNREASEKAVTKSTKHQSLRKSTNQNQRSTKASGDLNSKQ